MGSILLLCCGFKICFLARFAELMHAPSPRVVVARPAVDLDEAKTPVLSARATSSSGWLTAKQSPRLSPSSPASASSPALPTRAAPLTPHRPPPPRPLDEAPPPQQHPPPPQQHPLPPQPQRFCAHCGARAGPDVGRLCGVCGRAVAAVPAAPAAASKWKKPVSSAPERQSRQRQCSCGADNEMTAAQCGTCKAWF